jgi:hypothetical protein
VTGASAVTESGTPGMNRCQVDPTATTTPSSSHSVPLAIPPAPSTTTAAAVACSCPCTGSGAQKSRVSSVVTAQYPAGRAVMTAWPRTSSST